jgi:hypothetical protein
VERDLRARSERVRDDTLHLFLKEFPSTLLQRQGMKKAVGPWQQISLWIE